jgi:3-hydroxy-9,10-secoandrosta-1,3,5(10)-triene-9,17-dione monooxygenase
MTAERASPPAPGPGQQPVLTAEAALERARALAPRLRARVVTTEAQRTVPAESICDLVESGLFGVAVPRRWGGSELGFDSWIAVTATIAAACGSTGWVYGVLLGHDYLVASLPEAAQREVFAGDRSLVASLFRLGGSVTRVEGGYLWQDGGGRFCSGVDHVGWVIVRGSVAGTTEQRYFLIPRGDFEIVDDWQTMGLRGTGSKSIKVKSPVFIPEHRTAPMDPAQARLFTLSLLGAPLGIARGAFDSFEERLAERGAAAATLLFDRLARAGAMIDAAFALVLGAAARLTAGAPEVDGDLEWARQVRNNAYAVHQCQAAVNSLFEASGGSVVYESETFQRLWRDMNAAASHFVHYWEPAANGYGEAALQARSSERR